MSDHEDEAMPSVTQIVMTPEMLQVLIQRIQVSASTQNVTTANRGNFSKCSSKFSGRSDENVEAFIDSISIYKECVEISDDNALKGLSMLLHDEAAVWWQGVKSNISTFNDALEALRHAYGYAKAAYQIYCKLFAQEQRSDEPTDIFLSRSRALLSRLPDTHPVPEAAQLDMVFGLLRPQIREKLDRDRIGSFRELIEEARKVEHTILEKTSYNRTNPSNYNLNSRKSKVQ